MRKRGYEKEYQDWLNSKPVCGCGCGKRLHSSYRTYVTCINKYGHSPRYINKHQIIVGRLKLKILNEDFITNFNGCKIKILYNEEKRCDDFSSCPEYLKCLELVVAGHKGSGWERVREER